MGLLGSSSKSSSNTTALDNRVTTAGDQAAPIVSGSRNTQANGEGSIATKGNVAVTQTDSRNFGTSVDNLKAGNGSTINITSSDPALAGLTVAMQAQTAADALGANVELGRAALAANLGAVERSLSTVDTTNAAAAATQAAAIAALKEADIRRDRATTEAINAGLDLGRQSAAAAEAVTQSALTKLADQRAPDGANLTKIALWAVVALAAVFGLRLLRSPARS